MSQTLDRSRPPAAGTPRPLRFPAFEQHRLDNGLRILTTRIARVPIVGLELLLPGGGLRDPAARPGLANFYGSLLEEGSAHRTSLDIARTVERFGGHCTSASYWNFAAIVVAALPPYIDQGLQLIAELAQGPAFPEREVDRLRQQRLAELMRQRDLPNATAHRAFLQAIYRDGVYGHPILGTAAGLESISRDDLVDFHASYGIPAGSCLLAIGDLDPEQLMAQAETLFEGWRGGPEPELPAFGPEAEARGLRLIIVDRPQAAQTQLQLGHMGVPRTTPGHDARRMMNGIFGGKFTSRINLNLREKHGYTYGAQSFVVDRLGPGPFMVRSAVETQYAGAAIQQVLLEVDRMRQELVSEDELRETRDYLVDSFPYTLQSIEYIGRRFEDMVIYDLPADFYDHYPASLHRVSREEILETAREYLRPDAMVAIAVGPAETLRPQLEPLGPVEVQSP